MNTSNLILGRLPVKKDPRNFQMAALISKVTFPASFNFDKDHPGLTLPMFCNDVLGCCVTAARGHLTLRQELVEKKKVIKITDHEIMAEYYRETGGEDTGLVMLDSVNEWRKQGWVAGGKTLKIKAFAEIKPKQTDIFKQTVSAKIGAYIGVDLPLSSREELDAGKPWSRTTGKNTQAGSWGGHCVLVIGYDSKYVTCVTWGAYQKMTWAWFNKYCVEAYAIIDAVDTLKKRNLINRKKLEIALHSLAA